MLNLKLKLDSDTYKKLIDCMCNRIEGNLYLKAFFNDCSVRYFEKLVDIISNEQLVLLASASFEFYLHNNHMDRDVVGLNNIMHLTKFDISEMYEIEHANNKRVDLEVTDGIIQCYFYESDLYDILQGYINKKIDLLIEYNLNVVIDHIYEEVYTMLLSSEYSRYLSGMFPELITEDDMYPLIRIGSKDLIIHYDD